MKTSDLINKFSPVLELINGCGIIESCRDNHVIIAHNLFENNLVLDQNSIYMTTVDSPIVQNDELDESINFIIHGSEQFFYKQFAIDCGFYFIEKIENSKNYRIYFFASYYHLIYERIINNVELIKELFAEFKEVNIHILDKFNIMKTDFDIHSKTCFEYPNTFKYSSNKDKLMDMLKLMGVLNNDVKLTNEEWGFIDAYNYGKLYNLDMSHIYDLSKGEMEAEFDKIKTKLLK